MKRQRASLGELCSLVKGTSPISKTTPGPYTLVTTGESHKSADSFQLDAEAVCIPLISSTGHGHASLKRVHYYSGQFALANLLAAAIIKDSSVLSAKFLARYLMFTKDRLIVPLMTGAANMSISLDRLATVPIEFPPLAKQERIVKLLDEIDDLRELRTQADSHSAKLIPALFNEMFGDPLTNTKRFPLLKVGDLCSVSRGASPRPIANYLGGTVPWIRIGDGSGSGPYITSTAEFVTEEGAAKSVLIPPESLIVANSGASCGFARILKIRGCIHDGWLALLNLKPELDSHYLLYFINQITLDLRGRAPSGTQPNLNTELVKSQEIPLPPLATQKAFAKRVTEIREMEAAQAASRQRLEALFQSMLHRAFNGEL